MNDFDKLKISSEAQDDDIVVSVNTPKTEEGSAKKRKITVVSLFFAALKSPQFNFREGDNDESAVYTAPAPKYTLVAFLIIAAITVLLVLIRLVIDSMLFIPIVMLFASIALPCLILVFFIEFNTRKSIHAINIALLFVLGVFSYLLVGAICEKLLTKIIPLSYSSAFGVPIVWSLLLFITVIIFSNYLRVSKLPECFLIAVAFALGYSVAQSLLSAFSDLFVTTTLPLQVGDFVGKIIIDDQLGTSLGQMLEHWFMNFVYMPILLASMAVIDGTAVSFVERAKIDKRAKPRSIFILVILNIILYGVAVIETNFAQYNFIIKAFSLIIACFVEVKLLNSCLDREVNDVSK